MKLAILFFALAQLADIVTTKRALARPGAREANPVMRALFDRFGLHTGLLIKAAASVAIVVWLVHVGSVLGIWSVAVLIGVVAIHNHRLARKG